MRQDEIDEALRLVHAARRTLWMARQIQISARDNLALIDTTVSSLAAQLQEAENRAATLIGDDGADMPAGRLTICVDDRRAKPRPRFNLTRRPALKVVGPAFQSDHGKPGAVNIDDVIVSS